MKILLVEDDSVQVRTYEKLLETLDPKNDAFAAGTIAAALEWCNRHDADLVIVDRHLRDGDDGIDFVRGYRRMYNAETTPVLMVTSDLTREVRLEALTAGATDFLTKPIDVLEFTSRVRNMLALREYAVHVSHRAALLASEVKRATAALNNREHEIIIRLAKTAEYVDPTTGNHIQRIGHMARCIASALGLKEADCDTIFDAAPMHDIGKVAVPSAILLKPGPLTADEFEVVKRHPTVGYDILRESESRLVQSAAVIALSHHERWDGTGYPNAIKAEAIPLFGRITAVADVFDALTSDRPYKRAWPIEDAIAEIKRGSGFHFDPRVTAAFLAAVPNVVDIKARYASTA